MNKIYIYHIYFPTSNKRYIGQTIDLKKRIHQHFGADYLVGRALRKYNDWKVYILHTVKNRDEANRIEIEEIRNFNSVSPNGYNLTAGGEGGDTFTENPNREKIRANMSFAATGIKRGPHSEEHKAKISAAHKGKKRKLFTEEHKAKLSVAHKGKKLSAEHKAKISASQLGKKRGSYKKKLEDNK